MERELLIHQSPTAQVRILAKELLGDGRYHTRREITQYVEQKRQEYQLPEFRSGHIAGGIQQATVNCERAGRGNFRMRIAASSSQESGEASARGQEAIQILNVALEKFSTLARQIDYLEACGSDMEDLARLKESVEKIKEIKGMWER